MKIYIVGTVASGKSTLANKLGQRYNLPVYHLDELVHQKNATAKLGNIQRSDAEIDRLFREILQQPDFIIEDTLRRRFQFALQEVDKVVYIDLPMRILKYRVFKRFFKQKLGLEKANYKPSLQFLKLMLTWLKDSPRERVAQLPNLMTLHSKKDIQQFLEEGMKK